MSSQGGASSQQNSGAVFVRGDPKIPQTLVSVADTHSEFSGSHCLECFLSPCYWFLDPKSMIEDAGPGVKSKASTKFIEKTAKAPSAGGA
jgi:hypothetical protein